MDQSYCDALRFAIEYEQQGEAYYREAAGKTRDLFARKALLFLADEEIEHIGKIERFNAYLLGTAEFDLDAECRPTAPEKAAAFIAGAKTEGKTAEAADLSDLAVYDLAMVTETQGFEMYASVRDSSGDERLKRFFAWLADEEVVHYKLLAGSKKYLEDQSYYFEEAGGWIFG